MITTSNFVDNILGIDTKYLIYLNPQNRPPPLPPRPSPPPPRPSPPQPDL